MPITQKLYSTSKSRRGGAYIMVLTVTMLILLLAAIALSVTAVSRRLTAMYPENIGLFDLAVAGNEQAYFLLLQTLDGQKEEISRRAWAQLMERPNLGFLYYDGGLRLDSHTGGIFRQIFIEEAMNVIRDALGDTFTRVHFEYHLVQELDAIVDAGVFLATDSYRAQTVLRSGNPFMVTTTIRRYVGDSLGMPAAVRASIIWIDSQCRAIVLDAYTMYILEQAGAMFPFLSVLGENVILFLDEFTLAMVESLRIAT